MPFPIEAANQASFAITSHMPAHCLSPQRIPYAICMHSLRQPNPTIAPIRTSASGSCSGPSASATTSSCTSASSPASASAPASASGNTRNRGRWVFTGTVQLLLATKEQSRQSWRQQLLLATTTVSGRRSPWPLCCSRLPLPQPRRRNLRNCGSGRSHQHNTLMCIARCSQPTCLALKGHTRGCVGRLRTARTFHRLTVPEAPKLYRLPRPRSTAAVNHPP